MSHSRSCTAKKLSIRKTALKTSQYGGHHGFKPKEGNTMVSRVMRYLAIVVIGCGLSGCANYYKVKVNGYTGPGTTGEIKPGGTFFVMENKEAKNPLLEQEIRAKITRLLEARGYPVTTKFDKADYYLFFGYGMGEPRSVTVVTPDYGWGWGMGFGGPGRYYMSVPIVPFAPYAATTTIYDRWLLINVVEGPPYRTQKESRPVWVGEAKSLGASSDLRVVLNYLLVADFNEFGKNTGKAITVELKENDPAVFSLTH
jgi:hypothetical protein